MSAGLSVRVHGPTVEVALDTLLVVAVVRVLVVVVDVLLVVVVTLVLVAVVVVLEDVVVGLLVAVVGVLVGDVVVAVEVGVLDVVVVVAAPAETKSGCMTLELCPSASVTVRRTYFVPTWWNVKNSHRPPPSGQVASVGVGEPSSSHT